MNLKLFREIVNNCNDKDLEKFITFINIQGFFEGRNEVPYISDDELIEEAEKFMRSDYELVSNYLRNELSS